MVEGGAREVSESEMIEALRCGHEALQPVIAAQLKLRDLIRREKRPVPAVAKDAELEAKVRGLVQEKLVKAFSVREKLARGKAIKGVKKELLEALVSADSPEDLPGKIGSAFENLESDIVRRQIASEKRRIDGRGLADIRPISIEVGVLPRAHGSALFTR
ncbi:MAG TPA: polyribonucleotide nucleotidyltransferase, partial [Deltaproteobacteria bacterium]|nr:polyribonucleotide nucleotidyltransferase [Deltaproteobacteria bacterium]